MHHTNEKDQIMGPKLSGQTIKETNISSHLMTENIYKRWWGGGLYYEISVEPIILVALVTLAAAQPTFTEYTKQALDHLLDYCATNPYSKLIFHSSGMTLRIHIDASYLSELYARSRAGGLFS